MTLPTARDLAGRLGLPANDPATARATEVALAWARGVFRVDTDDELEDLELDANQVEAIAGYARDAKKLDKATFGYFAGGRQDEIPAAIGNLSKRWRPMLIGERNGFGFA